MKCTIDSMTPVLSETEGPSSLATRTKTMGTISSTNDLLDLQCERRHHGRDRVRLYAYAMKHTDALKTGHFLTVEAMMAKLGIISENGLKEEEKRLLSQLQNTVGCFGYSEEAVKSGTDILGGMIRQADTILCSDLGYVTRSSNKGVTELTSGLRMAEGQCYFDIALWRRWCPIPLCGPQQGQRDRGEDLQQWRKTRVHIYIFGSTSHARFQQTIVGRTRFWLRGE